MTFQEIEARLGSRLSRKVANNTADALEGISDTLEDAGEWECDACGETVDTDAECDAHTAAEGPEHTFHRSGPWPSCGSCGADLGPSTSFPWHLPDEDCRAIREPVTS